MRPPAPMRHSSLRLDVPKIIGAGAGLAAAVVLRPASGNALIALSTENWPPPRDGAGCGAACACCDAGRGAGMAPPMAAPLPAATMGVAPVTVTAWVGSSGVGA